MMNVDRSIYLSLIHLYLITTDVFVDAGLAGFPSDVTIGRGPWPSPRAEARKGATSATSTPSRIG
jgi:hypothetical protein